MDRFQFHLGDTVVLTGRHLFDGRYYDNEATAGSCGFIESTATRYASVRWTQHPDGFDGKEGSCVDYACLALIPSTFRDIAEVEVFLNG